MVWVTPVSKSHSLPKSSNQPSKAISKNSIGGGIVT
jgi:hypothetical protein